MLQIDPKHLPKSDELICSDEIPVDNEDQNFIPNVLLFLLEYLWQNRDDWFFAVDMGIYHSTGLNPRVPVVPDAFLSLGVPRRKPTGSRNSYVMWEEENVAPCLVLEVVSQTPGGEYAEKINLYAKLGVLYYVIYNPKHWRRDGHLPFEVYQLVNGQYQLQNREPFWLAEIGMGIGRCSLPNDPLEREVLNWFDAQGQRYLSAAEQEAVRADQEKLRRERLEAYLLAQGIDPNNLPGDN